MRRSHCWLLLLIVCLVAMPPLAFAGDCVPGDCQYLPDNGTKAACIGALVIGYVIYERSKEKNKTSADFEKQIREKMREFEELQRDLKDQLDYSMQDLQDFNDKYNDNLQAALKALDAYRSTYQQKLVPDLQNIWDTMSDHQLGRKIADWTDNVLAAAQIAEGGYQLGRAALEESGGAINLAKSGLEEGQGARAAGELEAPAASARGGPAGQTGTPISPQEALDNLTKAHGDLIPPDRIDQLNKMEINISDRGAMEQRYAQLTYDPKTGQAKVLPDNVDAFNKPWGGSDGPEIWVDKMKGDSGALQHEITHGASNPNVMSDLGRETNEAMTERFTRDFTQPAGINRDGCTYYTNGSVDVIHDMENLVGKDPVRQAYFGQGSAPISDLRQAVDNATQGGTFDKVIDRMRQSDFDGARKLLTPTPKP
jgi:hypothetical protein